MLHRVNYRSAAFGSESVAFEEPDQRVRKARSETMGLRVKSEVTIWRAARRVQSVSPPPPLSCADLIRASIYHAARSSVSPRRTGLRIQEPPDQEALHVTAAIGNQIDDHTPLLDAIDQPVGLEEDLAKLGDAEVRSEEHTSELQSLMRNSYAVFCLKKQNKKQPQKRKT